MEVEILKRAAAYFAKETRPPKMMYIFIAQACTDLPVATCCRVMKVSTSGFYAWQADPGHRQGPRRRLPDQHDRRHLAA